MLITLSEAARLSGGVLHPDSDGALVLRYVCADSREALKTEGPLFAAIRGERTAACTSARSSTWAARRL